MSLKYESPTRYLENGDLYSSCSDERRLSSHSQTPLNNNIPIVDPELHKEFFNVIQSRQNYVSPTSSSSWTQFRHMQVEDLAPINSSALNELIHLHSQRKVNITIIDVRAFSFYSQNRIKDAINLSAPSILLKRASYTLDRVCDSIMLGGGERLRKWGQTTHILFYDHSSHTSNDSGNSAIAVLVGSKLRQTGYKGKLNYLEGGFNHFNRAFPDQCDSTPLHNTKQSSKKPVMSIALPTPSCSNTTKTQNAANPFFSNIRQNLELSHGSLKERFSVRLASNARIVEKGTISLTQADGNSIIERHPRFGLGGSSVDIHGNFQLPAWLCDVTDPENGPKKLAEMYELLERIEQKRLRNVMDYHSTHPAQSDNDTVYPFSITAAIEKGALNRYDNIWPYDYSRVKLRDYNTCDYINASYIQYTDIKRNITLNPITMSSEEANLIQSNLLSEASLCNMNHLDADLMTNRRYISTQGPLPTTFNDFWQVVWNENSRVIVMLTQEEEMNKIKCHRYWPSTIDMPQQYGPITVTLVSETKQPILNMNEKRRRTNGPDDESITIRRFTISQNGYPPHQVTQLQYTGWTDFGVPDHPIGILQVIYEADEAQSSSFPINKTKGPMVVHCSAGCGRTGTFCVVDTIIQRLCQERDVYTSCSIDKIYETAKRFREQRMSMVQTHRQFVFCYEAVIWWLLGYGHLPTSTPLNEIAPEATDGTTLFLSNDDSGSEGSVGSMLHNFKKL